MDIREEIIELENADGQVVKFAFVDTVEHERALYCALESIENAIENLKNGMPVDIAEIDITNAWNYLGEITGETYQDELITTLFSNFCLGK